MNKDSIILTYIVIYINQSEHRGLVMDNATSFSSE